MREKQGYEIEEILQEMRSDYWRNLEAVADKNEHSTSEYLIVCLGGKRYGLPAVNCREVLKLPRLVRVPRLPDHLRGIINLRGEIVAVTDLCPLLGHHLQVIQDHCRLVVVEEQAIKTALLVEFVEGLGSISPEQIEFLAEGAGTGLRDLLVGKIVEGEEVLILLDLGRLLRRPELVVDQQEQAGANS
jgi:purine-binding chemotaxis protein CheW